MFIYRTATSEFPNVLEVLAPNSGLKRGAVGIAAIAGALFALAVTTGIIKRLAGTKS